MWVPTVTSHVFQRDLFEINKLLCVNCGMVIDLSSKTNIEREHGKCQPKKTPENIGPTFKDSDHVKAIVKSIKKKSK